MTKKEEIDEDILLKMGFVYGKMETENHNITIFFYDVWRLSIEGKEKHSNDDVYIEDYFTVEKFIKIIYLITDKQLNIE